MNLVNGPVPPGLFTGIPTLKKRRKEKLLPEIKILFTAQTVISSYQLKRYVWHPIG
jgi:hypothetical protein